MDYDEYQAQLRFAQLREEELDQLEVGANEARWAAFLADPVLAEQKMRAMGIIFPGENTQAISITLPIGTALYDKQRELGLSETLCQDANPDLKFYKRVAKPTKVQLPTIVYPVQADDTLENIAQKFGQTIEQIKNFNDFLNMPGYILKPGHKLRLLRMGTLASDEYDGMKASVKTTATPHAPSVTSQTGRDENMATKKIPKRGKNLATPKSQEFSILDEETFTDEGQLEATFASEAFQQFPKPTNDDFSFPRPEGDIENGITLALDADGDQAKKELVLHLKRQGKNVVLKVTHTPTKKTVTKVIKMGSVNEAKACKILGASTTDGVRKIKIQFNAKVSAYVLPPLFGVYQFDFSEWDASLKRFELKVGESYERVNTISVRQGPIKEGKYWQITFQVGHGDKAMLRVFDGSEGKLVASVAYFAVDSPHRGVLISKPLVELGLQKSVNDVVIKPVYFEPQRVGFKFFDAKGKTAILTTGAPDFYVAHQVSEYSYKEKDKLRDQGEVVTNNKPDKYAKVGLKVYLNNSRKGQGALFAKKDGKVTVKNRADLSKNDRYNARRTGHDSIRVLHKMQVERTRDIDTEIAVVKGKYMTLLSTLAKQGVIRQDTFDAWFYLQTTMARYFALDKPSRQDRRVAQVVADYFGQCFENEVYVPDDKKKVTFKPGFGRGSSYRGYDNPYTGESVRQLYRTNFGHLFGKPSIHTVEDVKEKEEESVHLKNPLYSPPIMHTFPALLLEENREYSIKQAFDKINKGYLRWVKDKASAKNNPAHIKAVPEQLKALENLQEGLGGLKEEEADMTTPQRIKAVFYPKETTEKVKPGKQLQSIPLYVYYYYHKKEKRWYVKNLSKPGGGVHKESLKGEMKAENAPPLELFKLLNDKDHLPKGWIYYQLPDGTPGDQVYVDGKWELKDWIKAVGVGLATIGLIISGVGAPLVGLEFGIGAVGSSMVATGTVLSTTGGILVSISGGMELYDIHSEERGNTQSYTGAILDLVSGFMGIGGTFPKVVDIGEKWQLAYIAWQKTEASVNSLALMITTPAILDAFVAVLKNGDKTEVYLNLLYMVAQGFVAFRTIQGNVANLKAMRERRIGGLDVVGNSASKTKGSNSASKTKGNNSASKTKGNNSASKTKGNNSASKTKSNIPQIKEQLKQRADQMQRLEQQVAIAQQQVGQLKTHVQTLKKMPNASKESIKSAETKLQKAQTKLKGEQQALQKVAKNYQLTHQQLLQAHSQQQRQQYQAHQAQLTPKELAHFEAMAQHSQRLGVGKSRLIQMFAKVKGNIPWGKKPTNLSPTQEKVYALFRPRELRIRYVQYKNGRVYRIRQGAKGEYIQYNNGKQVRVNPKRHQIYEAELSFTYTRHHYPVTMKETGGVYYQTQHKSVYLSIQNRSQLKTSLKISKAK